jgi:hypothetical protein
VSADKDFRNRFNLLERQVANGLREQVEIRPAMGYGVHREKDGEKTLRVARNDERTRAE